MADGPRRFSRIDDTNRADHARLTPNDECYYLFEYTSGKNYQFSATNSLISNLKKKPSRASYYELRYKQRDMGTCSQSLGVAINATWLNGATLVPVPPSKAVGHPDHDPRMRQICQTIPTTGFNLDVRELVKQNTSMEAAHEGGDRPSVEDLLAIYEIDESLTTPAPARMAIVDDVLTAGTHYRAMHTKLSARFPGVPIVGFFVARRVFPTEDVSEFVIDF